MAEQICPSCNGTGRPRDILDDLLRYPCRECGGSGYVEDYYDDDDEGEDGDQDDLD